MLGPDHLVLCAGTLPYGIPFRERVVPDLEQHQLFVSDPNGITHEVQDAVDQTSGRRLIIAPGCVVPVRVTPDQLTAARRAIGRITSPV